MLFQNLTSGYNSISRPVRHAWMHVELQFAIALNQILELDAKHEVLSTYVWIYETWYDENLKWKPEDFQGIDKIMFSAHNIWLPDIYIFNIAGKSLDGFVNANGTNVLVRSDGNVTWPVPLHIKSACPVDATFFPYDKQTCDIRFGSWIYDISQIDILLQSRKPDLSNYVLNNEFDIDSASLTRRVINSSLHGCKHPMVHLNIRLKRKTNYYDYIVIAPTLNLCVLTLATFLLPCECGWKIAIGLTVFLTLYVLQLLIAENVPDTSSTPLISVFLLLVMSLNCISLITATIVMNIKRLSYLEPPPEVPKRLLNLCENYLSKLICARLSDWKRIASNPEDRLIHENKSNRVQLLSTVDSFVMTDRTDSANTQYVQLKELPSDTSIEVSYSPEERRKAKHQRYFLARSKTTESSFSFANNNDNFIEEASYTDKLLKNRPSELSVLSKLEKINHSFQDEDSDSVETSFSQGFSGHRPSYRKAIRFGQQYCPVMEKTEPENSTTEQSVIASISKKYQWYFVADVIDTITFLFYIIIMFLAIFSVLVVTPLYA
ncbi:neuronal acetylcholine receptor subunit alpha-5-like isoform X2 [Mercenaria mercenaria]|nr:neuronal acetylcholine receptor subunit alpha-5-like isoform X2 [Mercenaria mercenaria]